MTTKPSMQSEAAAVAEKATAVGRGVEATEEQARAIICTANKAVEEAKTKTTRADGGGSAAGKPSSSSLKRSLEYVLPARPEEQGDVVVFRDSSPPGDLHRVFLVIVFV